MSIVLSPNLVLSGLTGAEAGLTLDHPIVGWDSIVTVDNIVATTEADGYPASNLANPATHRPWIAAAAGAEELTIATNSADDIDFVAIARHNLNSAGIAIGVGYYDEGSPPTWVELTADVVPGNDGPMLFRFTPQPLSEIVIRLSAGSEPAQIAVAYAGKLLVLPRKLYQGMTPIPYGRNSKATNGRAESGNYLGRIVTQEFVQNKVPLSLIDPAYYRDHIDAFINASNETPFFFGWRPQSYPDEIGYCFMMNNPVPVNESPHGLIAMSLEMTGIV